MKGKMKKIVGNKNVTLVLILIALIIIFTIWAGSIGKKFFAPSTLKNVLQAFIVTAFLTIGTGCLLISGNMDISLSAIGCFAVTVIGNAVGHGLPGPVGLVMMFALCALFGLLNGLLVSKLKFPAFIATLGVSYLVKGLTYIYSEWWNGGNATNLNFKNDFVMWFHKTNIFGLSLGIYVVIIFFIIYGIIVKKTAFGMRMVLVGGNPQAAKLAGINSTKLVIGLFINAAMLAGISGLFFAARVGQTSLTAMSNNQFTGMTAAMIGGISFGGGVGGMGGAFLGLMILNTFQVGMNLCGVSPYWVTTFSGVLLLIALTFDALKAKKGKAGVKKPVKKAEKEAAENV